MPHFTRYVLQALEAMEQLHPHAEKSKILEELVSDWVNRVPALRIATGHAAQQSAKTTASTAAATAASSLARPNVTKHTTSARLQASGSQSTARNSQKHCYVFSAALPQNPSGPVFHGLDCLYAFGNLEAKLMGQSQLGSDPPPQCHELSEAMQRAWISFCQCGDPKWGCPPFTLENPVQRVWTLPDEAGKHHMAPIEEQNKIWNGLTLHPISPQV